MSTTISIPANAFGGLSTQPLELTFSAEELNDFFTQYAKSKSSPEASALFQSKVDEAAASHQKTTVIKKNEPSQAFFGDHALYEIPLLNDSDMKTLDNLQHCCDTQNDLNESDSESDEEFGLEISVPTSRGSLSRNRSEATPTQTEPANLQVGFLSPYHNFMKLLKLCDLYKSRYPTLPQVSRAVDLCYTPIFPIDILEIHNGRFNLVAPNAPPAASKKFQRSIRREKRELLCLTKTFKVPELVHPGLVQEVPMDTSKQVAKMGPNFTKLLQLFEYYHSYWKHLPQVKKAVFYTSATPTTCVLDDTKIILIKDPFPPRVEVIETSDFRSTSPSESDRAKAPSLTSPSSQEVEQVEFKEPATLLSPPKVCVSELPAPERSPVPQQRSCRRNTKRRRQNLPGFKRRQRRRRNKKPACAYVVHGP
ncbi:uncharacterized protein CXQ87_003566 [Candidozyma duobushaemuli]|uniref:Uncharacterized protein n=1 Tax=Candidozyma duobushaemuli TaxID=1231522 RepID=A0A2V1ACC5_9ASCO|nr:uncharacterized protein CXQ87_003566 [[Candida] duobushaemulonis]PVH15720.1 hypothetical protein CXQ87_003566 [[Candida] duobushaemulonis]